MKPWPKLVGLLGVIGAVCTAVAGLAGVVSPHVVEIAAAVGTIAAALSHSLTGNGVYVPPAPKP